MSLLALVALVQVLSSLLPYPRAFLLCRQRSGLVVQGGSMQAIPKRDPLDAILSELGPHAVTDLGLKVGAACISGLHWAAVQSLSTTVRLCNLP